MAASPEADSALACLAEDATTGRLLQPTAATGVASIPAASGSPSSCPRIGAASLPWLEHKAGSTSAGAATAAGPPGLIGSISSSKRPRPASPSSSSRPAKHAASVALQAPSPPPPPLTTTALVYDAGHTRHAHPTRKHPERPERVEAVLAHLEGRGLLGRCQLLPLGEDEGGDAQAAAGDADDARAGVVAPESVLAGVHSQHYLTRLRRLAAAPLARLLEEAEGFDSVYLNEATVDCARRAAGALLALVAAVVQGEGGVRNGLALIRPPGHHAEAHHARGFCVLNNVAVAAQHARRALGVSKVLIVDWDIHHGNGTQRAFLADPSVLYFSVHRYDHGRFFPGTGAPSTVGDGAGAGYTVNVAWNGGGMGDREYGAVWRRLLLPVAQAFAPELILVSAGFDGADGDEMGGCRVTPDGFGAMTRALVAGVPSAQGRVVLALEGGYKLSVLSRCVETCVEALCASSSADGEEEEGEEEEEGAVLPEAEEAIARALEVHRPYWPCLRE